jgi:hypothetical protein
LDGDRRGSTVSGIVPNRDIQRFGLIILGLGMRRM